MYLAYELSLHLAILGSIPYLLLRHRRDGRALEGWRERLGHLPESVNPHSLTGIWIQAVSVGEVRLAATLLAALRKHTVDARFYLSTTTPTGQAVAREAMAEQVDELLYFPLDLSRSVERTLNRLSPALFISLETEIWPNLFRLLARRKVPAVIVNGRISPRAYRRYRRFRGFFRRVLQHLDLALMQTEEDARRLENLGLAADRIRITGNLKYDIAPPEPGADSLPQQLGIRPEETVILAGSTMSGEEEILLDAFEKASGSCSHPLLVLAPRHPERFDEVAELLERRGIPFVRRTSDAAEPERRVLLLDSLGELTRLFARARVIFIGGSLAPNGGHNILEPAVHARPVLFGPHMENFQEVAQRMMDAGGGFEVRDKDELAELMVRLVHDDAFFERAGAAALEVVDANRGALERTMESLEPYLQRFGPAKC